MKVSLKNDCHWWQDEHDGNSHAIKWIKINNGQGDKD